MQMRMGAPPRAVEPGGAALIPSTGCQNNHHDTQGAGDDEAADGEVAAELGGAFACDEAASEAAGDGGEGNAGCEFWAVKTGALVDGNRRSTGVACQAVGRAKIGFATGNEFTNRQMQGALQIAVSDQHVGVVGGSNARWFAVGSIDGCGALMDKFRGLVGKHGRIHDHGLPRA